MRKNQVMFAFFAALILLCWPRATSAQVSVGISVHVGPPALPVYAQPVCPGPGYVWTPGYWAYGADGYYWVPGTWVLAPVGMLWTPGYWGWGGGAYVWHAGYWGPHVGFYGGINYGFGYGGVGFVGGRWNRGAFEYNSAVSHVDVTVVHNTYVDKTVIVNNNTTINRTSFNGGQGGVMARPTPEEMEADHERHEAPIAAQTQHEHEAATNRAFLASENHGHPAIAATARPGEFNGRGTASRGNQTAFHPPARNDNNLNAHPGNGGNSAAEHPAEAQHNNGPHGNAQEHRGKENHGDDRGGHNEDHK